MKATTRRDGTVVRAHERSVHPSVAHAEATADRSAAAAAAASDNGSGGDGPPDGYLGVTGGLPPDRGSFAFWKASQWAAQNDMDSSVGPVRLPDGRHAVGAHKTDGCRHPRADADDLFVGLGTFAVMGDSETSRSRHIPLGDECLDGDRADWWAHMRSEDMQEAMPWMLREMRGEHLPDDEADDWSETPPTWDEMNEAAIAYHQRTGDYALPLYVRNQGQDLLLEVARPGAHPGSDAPDPHLTGEPSGFAFLTRKQALSIHPEPTVGLVHSWMEYAVDVRNDWGAGNPTEGTVAFFDNDPASDGPDQFIETNICKNDALDAALLEAMADR